MECRALSVAALAAALAFAGVLAGQARAGDPLEAMGGLRPAARAPAPDATFTTLEGHVVRVRDLRGKPVLLGFFTTW